MKPQQLVLKGVQPTSAGTPRKLQQIESLNARIGREGTGIGYKILALLFLLAMGRYRSSNFVSTSHQIKNCIERFEAGILLRLPKASCLDVEALLRLGLMKPKHIRYAAYLAALSSFPILRKAVDDGVLLNAILAKTSAITSIKVLDNVNDKMHDTRRAIRSLWTHYRSFTHPFSTSEPEDVIGKAENSCYQMAQWTYQLTTKNLSSKSPSLRAYLEDFRRYIEGQISSLEEKISNSSSKTTSIQEYIKTINEKGVGRIWVDIDFCFAEQVLGDRFTDEIDMEKVVASTEYVHKACNIYDDVADLEEDLRLGIHNSVVLLALDQGLISEGDLKSQPTELLHKLVASNAPDLTIGLGDLHFLESVKKIAMASKRGAILDGDSLVLGTRVLRAFAMRKWLLKEKSLRSLRAVLSSFLSFKTYDVPDEVLRYRSCI